jgi:hypothetical protein
LLCRSSISLWQGSKLGSPDIDATCFLLILCFDPSAAEHPHKRPYVKVVIFASAGGRYSPPACWDLVRIHSSALKARFSQDIQGGAADVFGKVPDQLHSAQLLSHDITPSCCTTDKRPFRKSGPAAWIMLGPDSSSQACVDE